MQTLAPATLALHSAARGAAQPLALAARAPCVASVCRASSSLTRSGGALRHPPTHIAAAAASLRRRCLRASAAGRGDADPSSSSSGSATTAVDPAATLAAAAAALLGGGGGWLAAAAAAAAAEPDLADAFGAYSPEGGAEFLKSLVAVAYIGLVIVYFVRLFRRRAQRATSQRIASVADAAAYGGNKSKYKGEGDSDSEDEEDEEEARAKAAAEADKDVTPLASSIAAVQAGFIAYLLFYACGAVDAFFDGQTLPEQYTARNIALLVQTVCRGAVYLSTFVFSANALGLFGLTLQLLILGPESLRDGPSKPKAAPLPKASVTGSVLDLRKAFDEAERMGQVEAQKELKQRSRDDE